MSRNPRDVGYPQISTAGLFSTMGDPTTFVSRNNEHFEVYDNFLIDRGNHRYKFGGYLFHLRFRPVNADTARGAFTYTGQWSGNAMADFLLGYPTSAAAGIGGGDQDSRTTWLHLYAQDDWRARDNQTINYGLRYEYNAHMKDVDNRLSSIDLSVPGGRFVVASDDAGNISPAAEAMLPLMPIPWVTSAEIGWDRSLLRPSRVRLAPRGRVRAAARRPALGGAARRLRRLPEPVGVTACRPRSPGTCRSSSSSRSTPRRTSSPPTHQTRDILTSDATGSVGGSIMDNDYRVEYTQTWSGGVQMEATRQTMVEVSYMGSYTIGADNSTIRNVPLPGPGPIDERRPVPELSGIRAIRFDGESIYHAVTFKAERRFDGRHSFNAAYTLSQSKDDASSPGATAFESNVPQNVDDIFPGEVALSSFDHRHQLVASGTLQLPFFEGAGGAAALFSGWRLNGIVTAQSGAPFTVNLGLDQANIGSGPAQRPDQIGDPNLPAGQRSPDRWFNTAAFALQSPFTFGSALRNSVFAPGLFNVDVSLQKDWFVGGDEDRLEFRWEIFNVLNRANFDVPNRIFGTPNFGRIFSALNAREMQFGLRYSF